MFPLDLLMSPPGAKVRLRDIDPSGTPGLRGSKDDMKSRAERELAEHVDALTHLQYRLYAENTRALLVILQGMDTSGKDGVVRNVFSGLNPQGCHVISFKKPSEAEADRDFLWRIHAAVPPRGDIGVFNRAHYEDVLIVRVHNFVPRSVWEARYDMINAFERLLDQNHVRLVKIFLHISKDEQKERLKARLSDPEKRWKFDRADLAERQHWDAYQEAYETVFERCSTPYAPWYIVPANRKWYRNWAIASILRAVLEEMNPKIPHVREPISPDEVV